MVAHQKSETKVAAVPAVFVSQVTCKQTSDISRRTLLFWTQKKWGLWVLVVGNPSTQRRDCRYSARTSAVF